jgi:hypothetical protein
MSKLLCNYIERTKLKYHFSATTKRTSMSCGNQNGWIDNLNNAPN